jgi:kynureninase
MAPVLASLEMFDEVGMDALRERSLRLTAYLEELLAIVCEGRPMRVITPSDPERRGAQLSIQFDHIEVGELTEKLRHEYGVIADARQPDVIRLAPVPMYSTFHDCWRAAHALAMLVPIR